MIRIFNHILQLLIDTFENSNKNICKIETFFLESKVYISFYSVQHLRDIITDLDREVILELFDIADKLTAEKSEKSSLSPVLKWKSIALVFEKPSLRRKASFEIAAADLWAYPIFFGKDDILFSSDGEIRESTEDIINNLSRFSDCIVARVNSHDTIKKMCDVSHVPIINGLCNLYHPTQALSDLYVIRNHFCWLDGIKIAWIWDGNNVATSIAQICHILNINFVFIWPEGYSIDSKKLLNKKYFSQATSIPQAVADADVIMTDTWVSMWNERDKKDRIKIFSNYQVNSQVMSFAKKDAIFMHCLPAYRWKEVTKEVIDWPQSVVFKQAVSRKHIARALYVKLLS